MTEKIPDRPKLPAESDNEAAKAAAVDPVRPATPEYGEYATPQEQAKAIAKSLPRPSMAASSSSTQSHSVTESPPHTEQQQRSQPDQPSQSVHRGAQLAPPGSPAKNLWSREATARPANAGNRLATTVLLALGLVYVLGGIPSYLELTQTLDQAYAQWGIGTYTPTNLTTGIGIVIMVTQILIWLATAFLAFRRLRQSRTSWWIPLVGAILAMIVSTVLIAILLSSDPAFTTFVSSA